MCRQVWVVLALGLGGACDGSPAGDADAPVAAVDAPLADAPGDPTACADPPGSLDHQVLDNTFAIAIGPNGMAYASFLDAAGQIAQYGPGFGSVDWAQLTGAPSVYALAVHPVTGRVFAGTGDGLREIDAATGDVTPLSTGQTRTVTVGADGAIYFTDGQQRIQRKLGTDAATIVTPTGFAEPSDLFFDNDGTLVLVDLPTLEVWRVTLDANHVEASREIILTSGFARMNAIARDTTGAYYVAFGDGLRRYAPAAVLTDGEVLAGDLSYDLAFSHGWLGCVDLYATGSGTLREYTLGVTGRP
jgi:hypothetical protein